MTVVGIDDTDSRTEGMCTTHLATQVADALPDTSRVLLIRLNPAVPHKTRGNAAIAIHTAADPQVAKRTASRAIATAAELSDPDTHPGLVVAPDAPGEVPGQITSFARRAMWDHLSLDEAVSLIRDAGYYHEGWNTGRGRIGALAAIGAWAGWDDWTYEYITYREPEQIGSDRRVNRESVMEAAKAAYPVAWDTVDRTENEMVCVPHTPGPVLFGIRGDDAETVRRVAEQIEAEPIAQGQLFVTNQGTDAHLTEDRIEGLGDGQAYRVTGTVTESPTTREGGHVFFRLTDDTAAIRCAAFEPTKRFRDPVRMLRVGDEITACGEVSDGTLKLEKFAVRSLATTEQVVPTCSACGASMESAGAEQGYRCRPCGTTADGKVAKVLDRDLEVGWYEVPPCARRHIAKPLVRGGFDAPVHPAQ